MSDLDKALERVDANLEASLERLFELLKIESISTDSAYDDQCHQAGQYLVNTLNEIGDSFMPKCGFGRCIS